MIGSRHTTALFPEPNPYCKDDRAAGVIDGWCTCHRSEQSYLVGTASVWNHTALACFNTVFAGYAWINNHTVLAGYVMPQQPKENNWFHLP